LTPIQNQIYILDFISVTQRLSAANLVCLRRVVMPGQVNCGNCGGKVPIPAGHDRAKIRCIHCGYYANVPPELRSSEPDIPGISDDDLPTIKPQAKTDDVPRPPAPPPVKRAKAVSTSTPPEHAATKSKMRVQRTGDPRDHRPTFEATDETPLGPNVLDGTQDDDDDKPYAIPGDGTKVCLSCKGKLPLDAKLCVHCGLDFNARRKPKRAFEPVNRYWEPRLSTQTRMYILAGLAVLNMLILLVLSTNVSLKAGMIAFMFQVGLQAWLVGTYESITVKRTSKGKMTITKLWRIAMVPIAPQEVNWKSSSGVGVICTHSAGVLEWITCAYLLLLGALPGIAFYFYVMHPDRYIVALTNEYGSTEEMLFRTIDRDQAEEIAETIGNSGTLQYRGML
jgi:hypothetical protein